MEEKPKWHEPEVLIFRKLTHFDDISQQYCRFICGHRVEPWMNNIKAGEILANSSPEPCFLFNYGFHKSLYEDNNPNGYNRLSLKLLFFSGKTRLFHPLTYVYLFVFSLLHARAHV